MVKQSLSLRPSPSAPRVYASWRLYRGDWRWPNFSPAELSCRHCGEYYHDESALDSLQRARHRIGKPFVITTAHRCLEYNRILGGKSSSPHLKIAFDIQLAGHDRHRLAAACEKSGFGSFGFYRTRLHVGMQPGRHWYGKSAQEAWV